MSHVSKIGQRFLDVDALVESAEEIGLEKRDKRNFKWYGSYVGDSPVPAGMDPADYGKCEFALGIKGDKDAYEIGVVKALDGGEGYELVVDTWCQTKLLGIIGGPKADKLKHTYMSKVAEASTTRRLAPHGFTVTRSALAGGRTMILARRR